MGYYSIFNLYGWSYPASLVLTDRCVAAVKTRGGSTHQWNRHPVTTRGSVPRKTNLIVSQRQLSSSNWWTRVAITPTRLTYPEILDEQKIKDSQGNVNQDMNCNSFWPIKILTRLPPNSKGAPKLDKCALQPRVTSKMDIPSNCLILSLAAPRAEGRKNLI